MVLVSGATLELSLQLTLPTPLSMLQVVALLVAQLSVEVSDGVAPRSIVVGSAVKVVIAGGGQGAQVTLSPQLSVTVQQTLPVQGSTGMKIQSPAACHIWPAAPQYSPAIAGSTTHSPGVFAPS